MKYFKLSLDTDNYPNAPSLINWYNVQDVRLIQWETFRKLKKRAIYQMESSAERVVTDIISFPFLLLSPMVKEVIAMYGDELAWRDVILRDTKSQESMVYHLPIMKEESHIELIEEWTSLKGMPPEHLPEWVAKQNICWITNKGKRHTIISLDLAESLLRRNAVGLSLREVWFREK